ncbi:unnamed protein product, partial [marine sediment metagenome]
AVVAVAVAAVVAVAVAAAVGVVAGVVAAADDGDPRREQRDPKSRSCRVI